MAKKDAETLPATQNTGIIEVEGKVLNVDEMTEALKDMKPGAELTSEYWTLEPGFTEKVYFIGNGEMKNTKGDASKPGHEDYIPTVKLLTAEGKKVICADKVLVSTLKDLNIPTPVEITCIGKTKSGKGEYRDFTVKQLS